MEKINDYQLKRHRFYIWRGVIEFTIELILWITFAYPFVWNWCDQFIASGGCYQSDYSNQLVQTYMFCVFYAILNMVVFELPFKYYFNEHIEHKFEKMMNVNFFMIFINTLKITVLELLAAAALVPIVLMLFEIENKQMLNILLFGFTAFTLIIIEVFYPICIWPLLNRLEPLRHEELKKGILADTEDLKIQV